jgi:hypothetical protein
VAVTAREQPEARATQARRARIREARPPVPVAPPAAQVAAAVVQTLVRAGVQVE